MSDVGGITGSPGTNGNYSGSGPLTVANALAQLRHHPSATVDISDSVQNIAKNLDALQSVAGKITSISTTDTSTAMTVTGAQYQKDGAALAIWGAGSGQTVAITAAKASISVALPSYVTSVKVADSRASIQSHLDSLETLATNGLLQEISQTGTQGNLSITVGQLTADQDALDKIKNHGYTLAITGASVSDALGPDGSSGLSTNSKVKSIAITDTTDAIASHLDDLQRVGLRIKSISQTDAQNPLSLTGQQYQQDKVVLGKIITSDMLDVIDASATQTRALASDHKVVTVDVQDTAKNLARNWSFLQDLADNLTTVQVTDQNNAIRLTSDQFAASDTLLSKFVDDGQHTYKLAVTNVSAGTATTVAGASHVDTVEVADSGANLVANLDDLETLNGQGKLTSVTVTNSSTPLVMDVSRFQAADMAATQAVLDKVKGGNYKVAIAGAGVADATTLASNKHIVQFQVADSSANIKSGLDALYHLGSRLTSIEQTDVGAAFDLTQTQLDSRASVLAKIRGGYTSNLTGVSAAKAVADATNLHVGQIAVTDTGRNILAKWSALRTLGAELTSITKSDGGAISLSADNYQAGVHDNLVSKFDQNATFAVTGASVGQAQAIAGDTAVTQIDMSDEGSAIEDNLSALETLVGGDNGSKIHSITNQTPTVSLSLDESALSDAQPVLSLIKGGSYKLAVTGVAASDAKTLVTNNHKIATVDVSGDADSIATNLSDLNSLGSKLLSITQTDAPGTMLSLTGAQYEQDAAALAKIQGGYLASLSQVSAAKAATFASDTQVASLAVSDTGANLSSAWGSLAQIGAKLTDVAETDSSALQIGVDDWNNGDALRQKFSTDITAAIQGARVSQVSDLASADEVTSIQVLDSASALTAALGDLAGQSKVTQLVVEDPTVAMEMTAQTYADSAAILGQVKDGQYSVALSDVSAQDATTLASDTHVASMDVSDSSTEIAANFDALASATNLNSISLTDQDETISLTAAQVLNNGDTLSKIDGSYQLEATGAAMADLANLQNIPEVTSISISDSADNVSNNFGDVLALGDTLSQLHLTDDSPMLSLSESDWTTGASALGTIDNLNYQVDVTNAVAGDAQTLAGNATVHSVAVADASSNLASNWDTLVGLYNDGAGKLTGLAITDENPLSLTTAQQTSGATMIAALLPDEDIQTAG